MSANYQFRTVSRKLRDGDHVDTPDLTQWVKDASVVRDTLIGVPEYTLVVRDLILEVGKAEQYLANRAKS